MVPRLGLTDGRSPARPRSCLSSRLHHRRRRRCPAPTDLATRCLARPVLFVLRAGCGGPGQTECRQRAGTTCSSRSEDDRHTQRPRSAAAKIRPSANRIQPNGDTPKVSPGRESSGADRCPRQSTPQVPEVINPALGCRREFPSGPRLPN